MTHHSPRGNSPTPEPSLADYLRAAVIEWLEASGREEIVASELIEAFSEALGSVFQACNEPE